MARVVSALPASKVMAAVVLEAGSFCATMGTGAVVSGTFSVNVPPVARARSSSWISFWPFLPALSTPTVGTHRSTVTPSSASLKVTRSLPAVPSTVSMPNRLRSKTLSPWLPVSVSSYFVPPMPLRLATA